MLQNKENHAISSSAQGEWVGYWESSTAGETELRLPERYAMLLVLEGEVTLSFKVDSTRVIGRQSMIMIDRKELACFRWQAGTALLEFTPPARIFRFFASCSKVFSIPCSKAIPLLPELQKWASELMLERLKPKEELGDECRQRYCCRLGRILNNYPPVMVGELLVAFQACSIVGEKKCRGGNG